MGWCAIERSYIWMIYQCGSIVQRSFRVVPVVTLMVDSGLKYLNTDIYRRG